MKKASFALIMFAVFGSALVVWVPGLWSSLAFEVIGFALAASWLIAALPGRLELRGSLALIPLAAAAVWGVTQGVVGITAYPWKTQIAVLYWAANAAFLFSALQVFRDRRLQRILPAALIIPGSLVAVVSVAQFYTAGPDIFWLFRNPLDQDQIMGPFLNRNHYCAFMELLLPIAMYRALIDEDYGPAYAVATGVMYASIIGSASRGAAVIGTAELIAVPVLLWWQGAIRRARAIPALGALALSLTGLVFAAGYENVLSRLGQVDPYASRREFYLSSLQMAKDHLWTGVGLGNWAAVYPRYALFDDGSFANQAHNDWAQWLAEGGLPMLLFMVALAAWAAPRALRSVWGIGVIAILLHSWVDFSLQRTPVAILFFVLLGALEYVDWRPGNKRDPAGFA